MTDVVYYEVKNNSWVHTFYDYIIWPVADPQPHYKTLNSFFYEGLPSK